MSEKFPRNALFLAHEPLTKAVGGPEARGGASASMDMLLALRKQDPYHEWLGVSP